MIKVRVLAQFPIDLTNREVAETHQKFFKCSRIFEDGTLLIGIFNSGQIEHRIYPTNCGDSILQSVLFDF